MRTDPTRDVAFGQDKQWERYNLSLNTFHNVQDEDGAQKSIARSFSGHERNRLYFQNESNFSDVSLLSGLDCREDSRGFAKFDYNHDGKIDVALVGPLAPRLRLFENQIDDRNTGNRVSVRCEGGANKANSQQQWSNRDGIGAVIMVVSGGSKRKFLVSHSGGLACQNSRWISIGLGNSDSVEKLIVEWPSGRKTVYSNLMAGLRVILHEDGNFELVE